MLYNPRHKILLSINFIKEICNLILYNQTCNKPKHNKHEDHVNFHAISGVSLARRLFNIVKHFESENRKPYCFNGRPIVRRNASLISPSIRQHPSSSELCLGNIPFMPHTITLNPTNFFHFCSNELLVFLDKLNALLLLVHL